MDIREGDSFLPMMLLVLAGRTVHARKEDIENGSIYNFQNGLSRFQNLKRTMCFFLYASPIFPPGARAGCAKIIRGRKRSSWLFCFYFENQRIGSDVTDGDAPDEHSPGPTVKVSKVKLPLPFLLFPRQPPYH